MEQAIKKAIEGGYPWAGVIENGKEFNCYYKTQLDPLFWQSLGKALELDGSTYVWQKDDEVKWLTLWHKFIDHLVEGKSADKFFTNLLK